MVANIPEATRGGQSEKRIDVISGRAARTTKTIFVPKKIRQFKMGTKEAKLPHYEQINLKRKEKTILKMASKRAQNKE